MNLSNENIVHIKKDGIEYLQFKKLLEYKDILNHAYSIGIDKDYRTEKANKEKLDEKKYQNSINNYKNLCDSIDSNYINIVKANQNHTDKIETVTTKINKNKPDIHVEKYENTDGLVTNKRNLILTTTNADCILLIFFDPVKKVIANTHSGWKGTLQRISVKTINKMQEEFNCNPQNIICCMAPSIRECHFEVEEEVKEQFMKEFNDIPLEEKWIQETVTNKKWNIDTIKINKIILQRKGLKPENIIDSEICSVCNSNLIHSYRVEQKEYGLNTLLVELK